MCGYQHKPYRLIALATFGSNTRSVYGSVTLGVNAFSGNTGYHLNNETTYLSSAVTLGGHMEASVVAS